MAVAHSASGSVATGTTSLSIAYPTCSAGDLLVVYISNKYPTDGPSAITDWTQITSDSSGLSPGTDTGNMRATVFYKVALGTESGNLAVTMTNCNTSIGVMMCYTKTSSFNWSIGYAIGSQNTKVDPWTSTNSITATSNPGLKDGDLLSVLVAINTNPATFTSQDISATGISSWGTMAERSDSGSNTGDDLGLMISEHGVVTGNATAAPVYSADPSATAAGSLIFLRLRETPTNVLMMLIMNA